MRSHPNISNYTYLLRYPPLLENTVKMVVLSPLLDMVGFFAPPFHIRSESSIESDWKSGYIGTLRELLGVSDRIQTSDFFS